MPQRLLQQQPAELTPDTAVVDTLSLGERLRADSTFAQLADPSQWEAFVLGLRDTFADPALWTGLAGVLLRVLLVFVLAWVLIRLIQRVSLRATRRFEALPPLHPRRQRAKMIGDLLASAARYVIWPLALITALSLVGIEIGALIATAGVAGLAIGFGAQTLVKDVIGGVFLLFDDTIHVGDLVRIQGESGVVEYIGVRLIKVRKFDGEVLMVPAGELRTFGNKSIGFVRLIVEVGLAYEQDIETVVPVMERVAKAWAAERREILLEDEPQVHAILNFADSSVMTRIVVQVIPGEQFQAERDLRIQLKRAFDELGVEIPFPRRTVYVRQEDDLPPRRIPPPEPPPSEDAEVYESD